MSRAFIVQRVGIYQNPTIIVQLHNTINVSRPIDDLKQLALDSDQKAFIVLFLVAIATI